jgi:hypothetical protein
MNNFRFSILLKQQQRLENQSNQGYMAEVMQQSDEMLRQGNPFAESYKRVHQMKYMNE